MISNPIYPQYPCITEADIANFKSTWLMVKRHKLTNLLYFCKTVKPDPYSYNGSGSYWKLHLNAHGKEHVETIWCHQFHDILECVEYALGFSEDADIVNSEKWANLVPEDGLGGWSAHSFAGEKNGMFGRTQKPASRAKISKRLAGRKYTDKQREAHKGQNVGEKNPFFGKTHTNESRTLIAAKASLTTKGEKNPSAKSFSFIDPEGTEFLVKGGFGTFCQAHNISRTKMHLNIGKGPILPFKGNNMTTPQTRNCVGWSVTGL